MFYLVLMPINLSPGGICLLVPSLREQIVALSQGGGVGGGGEAGPREKDAGKERKRMKESKGEREVTC